MAHLIALLFDDPFKGEEARAALHRMAEEGLLDIHESVLITRNAEGETMVFQEDSAMRRDQKTGYIAGLIAAAVTGTTPFILAGTLAGRLVGKLMDHGVTGRFVKKLKKEIEPGTSAFVLFGEPDPERRQKIQERLEGFGAKISESDLPPEVQQEIENEIERQKAA